LTRKSDNFDMPDKAKHIINPETLNQNLTQAQNTVK